MVSTDPVWYYFPPWMLWQNRGMWSRRNSVCSESRPKAFDMSSGIPKLPITSWSVDNIYNRVLCCKSISIIYNMHGWFLCWQHATGWVWWKSGLRAVAMWSSSSFTKSVSLTRTIFHNTKSPMYKRLLSMLISQSFRYEICGNITTCFTLRKHGTNLACLPPTKYCITLSSNRRIEYHNVNSWFPLCWFSEKIHVYGYHKQKCH